MVKGRDELPRSRIPELSGFVPACGQNPGTIRAKGRVRDLTRMSKGGDELARSRIPELGSFVSACRQDASTVGTKRHILNSILMGKGSDRQRQRLITMYD